MDKLKKERRDEKPQPPVLADHFQPLNCQSPSDNNQNSRIELIDADQIEVGSNHIPNSLPTSNRNDSDKNFLRSGDKFMLDGGMELYEIINCNDLENLNTKAAKMENYRRQLISLNKQAKRYKEKIEKNKRQLRNKCGAHKIENKKLKDQLKSYESDKKSTLANFEKETEAHKTENKKLKDQLASYHSWEKAMCHMKKCQTVIALKELLEALQLQPSNKNIKAQLDEAAEAIQQIDIKKLKKFEENKAKKYCLHLFSFDDVGVWRMVDIQKIIFPIKKHLNQFENKWNTVVLGKINDLSEQLRNINYN